MFQSWLTFTLSIWIWLWIWKTGLLWCDYGVWIVSRRRAKTRALIALKWFVFSFGPRQKRRGLAAQECYFHIQIIQIQYWFKGSWSLVSPPRKGLKRTSCEGKPVVHNCLLLVNQAIISCEVPGSFGWRAAFTSRIIEIYRDCCVTSLFALEPRLRRGSQLGSWVPCTILYISYIFLYIQWYVYADLYTYIHIHTIAHVYKSMRLIYQVLLCDPYKGCHALCNSLSEPSIRLRFCSCSECRLQKDVEWSLESFLCPFFTKTMLWLCVFRPTWISWTSTE